MNSADSRRQVLPATNPADVMISQLVHMTFDYMLANGTTAQDLQKQYAAHVLSAHKGNTNTAASILEINPDQLWQLFNDDKADAPVLLPPLVTSDHTPEVVEIVEQPLELIPAEVSTPRKALDDLIENAYKAGIGATDMLLLPGFEKAKLKAIRNHISNLKLPHQYPEAAQLIKDKAQAKHVLRVQKAKPEPTAILGQALLIDNAGAIRPTGAEPIANSDTLKTASDGKREPREWTPELIKLLKEHYPTSGSVGVAALTEFSGFDIKAIKNKAFRAKIKFLPKLTSSTENEPEPIEATLPTDDTNGCAPTAIKSARAASKLGRMARLKPIVEACLADGKSASAIIKLPEFVGISLSTAYACVAEIKSDYIAQPIDLMPPVTTPTVPEPVIELQAATDIKADTSTISKPIKTVWSKALKEELLRLYDEKIGLSEIGKLPSFADRSLHAIKNMVSTLKQQRALNAQISDDEKPLVLLAEPTASTLAANVPKTSAIIALDEIAGAPPTIPPTTASTDITAAEETDLIYSNVQDLERVNARLSLSSLRGKAVRKIEVFPTISYDQIETRFGQFAAELAAQSFLVLDGEDGSYRQYWRPDGIYAEILCRPNETVAKLAIQVVGLDGLQPKLPTSARGLDVQGFRADCASLSGPCEIATLILPIGRDPQPITEGLLCLNELVDRNAILRHWAVPPVFSTFLGLQFSGRNPTLDQTPAILRPLCRPDAAATFSKR